MCRTEIWRGRKVNKSARREREQQTCVGELKIHGSEENIDLGSYRTQHRCGEGVRKWHGEGLRRTQERGRSEGNVSVIFWGKDIVHRCMGRILV